MTDVPYGRGGSPLQNLILDGQTSTMVTALRMVEEMDAEPVYDKRPMILGGRAEDIYLLAGELCWQMID
jgi:methionyl-tRNA formyltransferase